MFYVICFAIFTTMSLHASGLNEISSDEDSPRLRGPSLEYNKFSDETILVNLKADRALWKLLRHNKLCVLPSDASKPLAWVHQQAEILGTQIDLIDAQMQEYSAIVWLEPFETTKEQIKAINHAMHSVKKAARSDEKRSKLATIRQWRTAAQQKQKLEKLVLHLDAFYEAEKF